MGRLVLTVAIPTFNGSRTIRTMLDVLLPQVTDEVEVLVSDNCSTDETPQILKGYIEKYPSIRYVRKEENIGADGNFLWCMQNAKGKYVMLLSDDDVLVEGALEKIVSFLSKHEVSLAFLETASFHGTYSGVKNCDLEKTESGEAFSNTVTDDRRLFFSFVGRFWGFTSSFICNTERVQGIINPEQYSGTFWMQSYIHVLCSDRKDDNLGVIAGPCIAAGNYGILGNYDPYLVEAVYYRQMLDFAIERAGYDRKQLINCWVRKVSVVLFASTIKQKSIGVQLSSSYDVFNTMKRYPYAWVRLFPAFALPRWSCKLIVKAVNARYGREGGSYINRPT